MTIGNNDLSVWGKAKIPQDIAKFKELGVGIQQALQLIAETSIPILRKIVLETSLDSLNSLGETENINPMTISDFTPRRSRCCDCYYHTGDSGDKPHHVICAVNPKVQPSREELRKARGRKAEAWHDCKDFKKAVPVFGGYSERLHTFDFDD